MRSGGHLATGAGAALAAIASVIAAAAVAVADSTVVLTPHVQEEVAPRAKELARRIGEAIRRRLAAKAKAKATETRTLPIIAEALRCDVRTPACLRDIAALLDAERVVSGELSWRDRTLVVQDYRRGAPAIRAVETSVSDDVLDASFDAWIEHVLRRLAGQREGVVVLHEEGNSPWGTTVRIGARLIELELPSFIAVGRQKVAIERSGERLVIGSLDVRDGRRHERFINFQEARYVGSSPPSEASLDDAEPLAEFVDDPIDMEARLLATGYAGEGAPISALLTAALEVALRKRRLVVDGDLTLGAATGTGPADGADYAGLVWSYRVKAGVGILPGGLVSASLVAGLGGSGITGLVPPAFEVPVGARLAFDTPLRPAIQLGAAFTLDDDRADGTRVPFAGDLEASVDLALMRRGKGGVSRGLVLRLSYREIVGQELVGISLGYGEHRLLGERRRPTLTEEPEPL